jgi:hypothetical protein
MARAGIATWHGGLGGTSQFQDGKVKLDDENAIKFVKLWKCSKSR